MQKETDDLALLAGMVKGNMRKIDSLMTDLSDRQADNIDLRRFINVPQPKQPSNSPEMTNYPAATENPQNNSPQMTSYPINNSSYSVAEKVEDDELKQNIESIKLTLEKINGNLTKLTGMFGKVFQSLTSNKNG